MKIDPEQIAELLLDDEAEWVKKHQERCKSCGHLELFHHQGHEIFCLVGTCRCEEGRMPSEK